MNGIKCQTKKKIKGKGMSGMGITLEEVEFLKAKAKLNYREVIEVLEEAGGDLLEAMALLEEKGIKFTSDDEDESIWQKLWKRSKSIKIKVNGPEGTVCRIPLPLGVAAVAAFPRLAVWGGLGLILARCFLEIESR